MLGGLAGVLTAGASWGAMPSSWRRAGQDPAVHAALVRAVEVERFRGGFGDMVPLATSLLAASEAASGDAAVSFAMLAAEAAPEDPRPRLRLASLAVHGQRGVGTLLRDAWALAVALVKDPWVQAGLVNRLALAAGAGALLAALALGFAAAPACVGPLFHDYVDAFPATIRRFTPTAFALLALVALWGGGVGPGLLGAGLALALSAYLRPAGRWALGLSLALACVLFPSFDWASRSAGLAGERAWALYRVIKGDSGPGLWQSLTAGGGAAGPQVSEARSLLARRAGRYGEAIGWLNRALEGGARESAIRLEMGNLFFLQGRLDEAVGQYERAAAADATDPRPWLNLHVTNLKRLALAEADRALEKARALDAVSLSRFQQAQGGDGAALLPVTAPPEGSWVRDALWESSERDAAVWPRDLWQALVLPAPWLGPGLAGAAALLITGILGTQGAKRLSRRCPSCGEAVCPRCGRRVKGSDHCPPCWAILSQKGGDAAERARRQQLMATWRLRATYWRRLAAALLPGWGDFAFEGAPRFLIVGVLWSLAGGALAAHALYPAPLLPWGGPQFPWFGVSLLAVTYGYGVRRALRWRRGFAPGRG